jgi:hypothetical protein
MSITFPSLKPSQRSFKLGAFPTKIYRSLSGATAKRSYGNKPFGYELQLVFSNTDGLRGLAQESSAIRWEYAGPPEVESIIGGRSTVQLTLIGEQNV